MILLHNIVGCDRLHNSNYNSRSQVEEASGVLSFDGVYQSVYENRDLLQGREVVLFVMGAYVGGDNSFDVGMPFETYCDWNQIMELVVDYGCKLGWHTWTHPDLTTLEPEGIEAEVRPPLPMEYFAYPYGLFNRRVIRAVKRHGFKDAWSVHQGNGRRYQRTRRYLCW